jgi:hypothetical protein
MSATMQLQNGSPATSTLRMGIGLPGRIAVSWTAAGGFLVGGFLVAAMTLAGRLSGMGLLVTASGLFVIGAVLGYIHGATLGFFGRPAGMTPRDAAAALGMAAVYALPATAIGLVVSGWIAMTVIAQYAGRTAPWIMVAIAWSIGAGIVAYAATKGWQGLRNAYARWPQRRLGTTLVAASFASLLIVFLAERPELWGIQMRVTETGAFALAAFATLWIAGPIVTIALKMIDQIPAALAGRAAPSGAQTAVSVAAGLAVGVVLGLLALPFYGAPLKVAAPAAAAAGSLGTLAIALSQAMITETLLRLFLMTAVAWVLLRAYNVSGSGAALAAVLVGAVAQLVLYMPAVFGIGFPSLASAFGFVGLVVLLPALAFGALYWMRGFGTALVAHATAVAMIAFLA